MDVLEAFLRYKRVTIKSPHDPVECAQRIRLALAARYPLFDGGELAGSCSRSGFSMCKSNRFRNSWRPWLFGRFIKDDCGTLISCRIGLHPFPLTLTLVWGLGVIAFPLLAMFLGRVVDLRTLVIAISASALMLTILAMMLSFSREAAKGEAVFLVKRIAEKVDAVEQPVDGQGKPIVLALPQLSAATSVEKGAQSLRISRSTKTLAQKALPNFGTAGWLSGMGSFVYFFTLQGTSPIHPSAETNQIVGMSDHGYWFYVRPEEKLLFNVLWMGGIAVFLMSAAIYQNIFCAESGYPNNPKIAPSPWASGASALLLVLLPSIVQVLVHIGRMHF